MFNVFWQAWPFVYLLRRNIHIIVHCLIGLFVLLLLNLDKHLIKKVCSLPLILEKKSTLLEGAGHYCLLFALVNDRCFRIWRHGGSFMDTRWAGQTCSPNSHFFCSKPWLSSLSVLKLYLASSVSPWALSFQSHSSILRHRAWKMVKVKTNTFPSLIYLTERCHCWG